MEPFFSLDIAKGPYTQGARYLITGGTTALVDLLLLVVLVERAGLHYLVAGGSAFIAGVVLNYGISRRWVFRGRKYSQTVEFAGFLAVGGFGLLLNQTILWVFVSHLGVDYRLSKGISVGVVTSWNFITKKYLIFGG